MTNKILITVKVPLLEKEYDIYIPVSKYIKNTTELLINTIHELSEGHFPKKETVTLMLADGSILRDSYTIKNCGLKNGDTIILV